MFGKLNLVSDQGLIQKDKVHIDCEKGAQISNLANKIAAQWLPNIFIKESLNKLFIAFIFYFLELCSHYVADLIKK